ncbi:MAG: hypothetical protein AAF367_10880 [Pseudomonadota bacterium]
MQVAERTGGPDERMKGTNAPICSVETGADDVPLVELVSGLIAISRQVSKAQRAPLKTFHCGMVMPFVPDGNNPDAPFAFVPSVVA